MLVEYTIVITHQQQIGYSVANAPWHVFIPPSVKGVLTPSRSNKSLTFTVGKGLFPSSDGGIADTLQIPILRLAFSHLFGHPHLRYLPFGCTRLHRPESNMDWCKPST